MSKKKLLAGGAGLALLYALTEKKSQTPTGGGIVVNSGATSTETQNEPSLIGQAIAPPQNADIETWKRPQWAQLYKYLYETTSPANAANVVWQQWDDERNRNRSRFPNMDLLIFDLATYRPTNGVGATASVATINADSIPVYQTWGNWWNNVPTWDCEIWKEWYNMNALKYGQATARNKFVNAWAHPDNFSYTFSAAGNDCGIDCNFVNYFRTKGIDVAYTGVETICNLVSVPSTLIDATASAASAANTTIKTVGTLLPFAVVALGGMYIYKQYKSI